MPSDQQGLELRRTSRTLPAETTTARCKNGAAQGSLDHDRLNAEPLEWTDGAVTRLPNVARDQLSGEKELDKEPRELDRTRWPQRLAELIHRGVWKESDGR